MVKGYDKTIYKKYWSIEPTEFGLQITVTLIGFSSTYNAA